MSRGVRLLYGLFLINEDRFNIIECKPAGDNVEVYIMLWGINITPYKITLKSGK